MSSTEVDQGPVARGFSTLEEEVVIDRLPLSGTIPDWIAGSLLRTGPARFEVGERKMRHWFDGLAMLHRFTIAGGEVSYGNRYLESNSYRAARERGDIVYGEFATDPCRSLFRRVQSIFTGPSQSDNGNVNVARLGDRFIALTETPLPVEFDPQTLAAADVRPYTAPGQLSTAHPHLDRTSGGMLNYAAKLGPSSSYRFFQLDPQSSASRTIASLAVREPAYMHSFGLSERWIVLAEFPFVVNPLSLVLSGRPYIENYRWKPQRGTRFTLIDRRTGEACDGFQTDACFAFHHVNSYDSGGELVLDICTYPDARIVEDLYLERLRAGAPVAEATLTRFRLGLSDRSVRSEPLCETALELPRINYGRCNERPHQFVWGVANRDGGWLAEIVKVDTRSGDTASWSEADAYAGEPVFLARPGADDEDDGVLLSVVFDAAGGRSFLLLLDAVDLAEIARAELPHHIPFGFHGQFASGQGVVARG